jgi:carbon monoxide dehydrogenase subunit G
MPRLHETIDTSLPPDEAFAFIADFANCPQWDPNTPTAERIGSGPAGAGARYKLGVLQRGKVVPMEYTISAWEPSSRVVLDGVGSGVRATDDIRFTATPTGTRVDYTADIHLTGLMRLAEPFAGGAFDKIAKDAAAGMKKALDARAETAAR